MTKKDFLRDELLNSFMTLVSDRGYCLNKSNKWFTQETSLGWNRFQLIFLNRDSHWEIVPEISIRIDRIEEIYHDISRFEKKYQKATPTIGLKVEEFVKTTTMTSRFDLGEEKEVEGVTKGLFEQFETTAKSFYSQYSDLQKIDDDLNSNPNSTYLTGVIFKGLKSIISARLMRRSDYEKLVEIYRQYYERFSPNAYLIEYENLLKKLSSV